MTPSMRRYLFRQGYKPVLLDDYGEELGLAVGIPGADLVLRRWLSRNGCELSPGHTTYANDEGANYVVGVGGVQ